MPIDNDIVIKHGDATETQRAAAVSIQRDGDDWVVTFPQTGEIILADGMTVQRILPAITVRLSQLVGKQLIVNGQAYPAELAAALIKAAYIALATGAMKLDSTTPFAA